MTSIDIIREIVEAENSARAVYEEAVRKQEGFYDYIAEETARLRAEFFAKADEEIAKFQALKTAQADKEIKTLNRQRETGMKRASSLFESKKEELAERMFDIVVGRNA